MNDHFYDVLCISRGADALALRTAYRRAALRAHPDKGGSQERFHLVSLAFETLSKQDYREVYDHLHVVRDPRAAQTELIESQIRKFPHSTDSKDAEEPKWNRTRGVETPSKEPLSKASGSKKDGIAPSYASLSRRRNIAMERLRSILQSLNSAQRREAMAGIEPKIRRALLTHLQSTLHKPKNTSSTCRGVATPVDVGAHQCGSRSPKSGVAGVHSVGAFYRASVAAANLEIYCRLRPRIEEAIEDHIILIQIRDTVLLGVSRETKINQQVDDIMQACCACLARNGTSERELQLRAKVRVRATQWMGSLRISSPVLPFEEAIQLRANLLRSRQASWQSFRAECVALLQREIFHRGRRKHRSPQEAEIMADKAWASAAAKRKMTETARQRLLANAIRKVAAVLELEERRRSKEKARARAVAEKRARANRCFTRHELRKWYRRRDLTMEEIIRGPPAHLRQTNVQKMSG